MSRDLNEDRTCEYLKEEDCKGTALMVGPSSEWMRNGKPAGMSGAGNLKEEWQERILEREGGDTPCSKALDHLCLLESHCRILIK